MHRLRSDHRGHRVRRRSSAQDQCAAQDQARAAAEQSRTGAIPHTAWRGLVNQPAALKFVSSNRRVREDRRFVAGQGRYVADVALEGLLHVSVLPSQHPAARIVSIDTIEAMKMPGVHYVLTG